MRRTQAFTALWRALRGHRRPGGPGVGEQLSAVPRMVTSTLSGRYDGLDRGRLALMAVALVYVVSPVDLIPEGALLLLGLGDDALVLAWLTGELLVQTQAFLAWEAGPARAPGSGTRQGPGDPRIVPGQVV